MNINSNLKSHILASSKVKLDTLNKMKSTCEQIIINVSEAITKGNKILIFGNGGSAADSQHLAAEFMSVLEKKREAISAISLSSDVAFITAHSNDFNFNNIFARQISGLAKPGDVLIGISTSGNSENVIKGMKLGKKLGLLRISFTGITGKKLMDNSDLSLIVQSDNTQLVQETYMCFSHALIAEIEQKIEH